MSIINLNSDYLGCILSIVDNKSLKNLALCSVAMKSKIVESAYFRSQKQDYDLYEKQIKILVKNTTDEGLFKKQVKNAIADKNLILMKHLYYTFGLQNKFSINVDLINKAIQNNVSVKFFDYCLGLSFSNDGAVMYSIYYNNLDFLKLLYQLRRMDETYEKVLECCENDKDLGFINQDIKDWVIEVGGWQKNEFSSEDESGYDSEDQS